MVYIGFKDKPPKKVIWKGSDISKYSLVPTGDMLFDFLLVSTHIQPTAIKTPTSPSPSLPGYSCVDYGFGSDSGSFAGAHRFAVVRQERDDEAGKEGEEEYVELKLECFRCNPLVNRESWAEWVPWLHYWYARFLWAEAVRSVLRG